MNILDAIERRHTPAQPRADHAPMVLAALGGALIAVALLAFIR